MALKHKFRNERGNEIELQIAGGEREDELTYILAGPSSKTENTITELEAYRLGTALLAAWRARHYYRRLIGPMRAKAKQLGYAIAVHGTIARDIDLVAIPWAEEAAPARVLAEAVQAVASKIAGPAVCLDEKGAANPEYFRDGMPGNKPHGRLVWSLHLDGGVGPYIDLSVMPRLIEEPEGR